MDILLALNIFVNFALVMSAGPINVARGKEAFSCRINKTLTVITDGITAAENSFDSQEMCAWRAFINVKFDSSYYIHYVIVHRGKTEDSVNEEGDRFDIELLCSKIYYLCSSYFKPGPKDAKNLEMRLNCRSQARKCNELAMTTIKYNGNVILNVAEIEAYTFGTYEGDVWIHRGCFESVQSRFSSNGKDWKYCKNACFLRGYPFAAIKNRSQCDCAVDHPLSPAPQVECDQLCPGTTSFTCGGVDTHSVYLVMVPMPTYFGCFERQNGEMILMVTSDEMIPKTCIDICEGKRAALQNGKFCFCGEDYFVNDPQTHSKEEQCDKKCSGDPHSYCGSFVYYSAYRGCEINQEVRTPCSFYFRCSGEMDEYGVCKEGCKEGYTGKHCLEMPILINSTMDQLSVAAALRIPPVLTILILTLYFLSAGEKLLNIRKLL